MHSELWGWLAIAGLTIITIFTRSFFLILGKRVVLPPRVQRGLRYAPTTALVAIIVPNLLIADHQLFLDLHNYRLIAGILACLAFIYTRNMLFTIFFGMGVFTLLRLLP